MIDGSIGDFSPQAERVRETARVNTTATYDPEPPGVRAFRISGRAGVVVIRIVPVCHPLSDISGHVAQTVRAVTVGGLGTYIGGSFWSAFGSIADRHDRVAAIWIIVSPRIQSSISSPGGLFPLGLCRKTLACPLAVLFRLFPVNADHRLVGTTKCCPDSALFQITRFMY